jgi:hypothetical protein
LTLAFKQRIVRGVLNERVAERIPGIDQHSVPLQEAVTQELGELLPKSRLALAGHGT